VKYIVTPSDGCGPACVLGEIGGDKREAIAGLDTTFFQHGANFGFALEITHSGANLMACAQKLRDGMSCDETGTSGDENRTHWRVTPAEIAPIKKMISKVFGYIDAPFE